VFLPARKLYEEALAIAHKHIADGLIFPQDELTYRLNLGLCCKRCHDWLAAETHYKEALRLIALAPKRYPMFMSFAANLNGNIVKLVATMCHPLGTKAPPETAVGMKLGGEESERLRLRENEFFKLGKYDAAIRMYSHAMGALEGRVALTPGCQINYMDRSLLTSCCLLTAKIT
jgi:tetratricopeptide (TPR) repeat protein